MITDKEHPMKINLTLDLAIPVHANTLTIHNDAVYNFDDYYENHLKETIEDMVSSFLLRKISDIVSQVSSEVESSFSFSEMTA